MVSVPRVADIRRRRLPVPSMRVGPRWVPAGNGSSLLVPVAAIALAAITLYLPWYALGPGPARAVQPLIRFEDHERFESEGRFVMTTVHYSQLTGLEMVLAWLDPHRASSARSISSRRARTRKQEHERSISQMDTSKLDASSSCCASSRSTRRSTARASSSSSVVEGCAADGELYPGDSDPRDRRRAGRHRLGRRAARSRRRRRGAALTFDVSVDGEPETVSPRPRAVRRKAGAARRRLVDQQLPVRRQHLER